ncbi:MAG: hypothetical protein HYS60_01265 [Candidatus Wildermuthbacteria bacterium]|nr:hypothetical protein [Candidatus Wildermuthbacteria bacterium]
MSLKQLIILFLILFLIPVFFGKVSLAPFADFFTNISWETFKGAFTKVLGDDFAFYKNLADPWIQKVINIIKGSIPSGIPSLTQ